jgi:hypothetical protein
MRKFRQIFALHTGSVFCRGHLLVGVGSTVPTCTFIYDTDFFLFSENFIPGRSHPAKVLKSINIFDTELGELVNQLMTERDMDVKRLPGRPRRGDERPDKRSFVKKAGLFFFRTNSTLLHLPPCRFHCADGCWYRYRTQDRCNWCIGSQTL